MEGCDACLHSRITALYPPHHKQVAIGSNDGTVRMYDAKRGHLLWSHTVGTPTEDEVTAGFSQYDIKEACAYSAHLDILYVGAMDGTFVAIERASGARLWEYKAEFAFWSTPCVYEPKNNQGAHVTYVYATSLDKHIYCFNGKTGELVWKHNLHARVFCAPYLWHHNGDTYMLVGANTGRLTALDIHTGRELWYITLPERIVNAPAYNAKTQALFVPTFANELYKCRVLTP